MIWGKCHNTMLSEIKQMGQKQCDMLAYHIMIRHITYWQCDRYLSSCWAYGETTAQPPLGYAGIMWLDFSSMEMWAKLMNHILVLGSKEPLQICQAHSPKHRAGSIELQRWWSANQKQLWSIYLQLAVRGKLTRRAAWPARTVLKTRN